MIKNHWDEKARKNNKQGKNKMQKISEYSCAKKNCPNKALMGGRFCADHKDEVEKTQDIDICKIHFKVTTTGAINIAFEAAEAIDDESLLDLLRMAENKVRTGIFARRFNANTEKLNQKGVDNTEGGKETLN